MGPLMKTSMLIGAFLVTASSTQGQHISGSPIDTRHISETRIAAFNIAITGSVALARGVAVGQVRTPGDAARHAAAGMLAGYGFFEAKRRIGRDDVLLGLGMAYTSASFLRNVSEGRHALGTLCAGPGPVDLCVRTGLSQGESAGIRIEANALALGASAVLLAGGMRLRARDGVLYFEARESLGATDDGYIRTGYTFGRTVVLGPEAQAFTWRHELVHLVQVLQIGSIMPYGTARDVGALLTDRDPRTEARRWDVQIDWLFIGLAGVNMLIPYERQWNEIEAYRLTDPHARPRWRIHPW